MSTICEYIMQWSQQDAEGYRHAERMMRRLNHANRAMEQLVTGSEELVDYINGIPDFIVSDESEMGSPEHEY